MGIICSNCKYDLNPPGAEFCESCGEVLASDTIEVLPPPNKPATPVVPIPTPPVPVTTERTQPSPAPAPTVHSTPAPIPSSSTTATRLVAVQSAAPIAEFCLDGDYLSIGRFDPDTGPVDIDLDAFQGADTVSRQHAEIYRESGQWKIKDLGSTNGIFVRKQGERRFSSRLLSPEIIQAGDEIAIGKVRLRVEP